MSRACQVVGAIAMVAMLLALIVAIGMLAGSELIR